MMLKKGAMDRKDVSIAINRDWAYKPGMKTVVRYIHIISHSFMTMNDYLFCIDQEKRA